MKLWRFLLQIVQMGTISAGESRELEATMTKLGARWVEAPVRMLLSPYLSLAYCSVAHGSEGQFEANIEKQRSS